MSKKKDLAKRPGQQKPDRSDGPDEKTALAVVRTTKAFQLATTAVMGAVVFGCFYLVYLAFLRVVGTTTDFNFNFSFAVNVAISVVFTAAVSGGAIAWGRREKKRADRLASDNDTLREKRLSAEKRADQAEERAKGLSADLRALRKDREG